MSTPLLGLQRQPTLLFVGTAAITALVIIWLVWATWTSATLAEHSTKQSVEFQRVAGDITYFDEVLTMAALMAASTGDPIWHKRYSTYVPRLDLAIARAISLAGDIPATEGVKQTQEANQKLISMEERAFSLVSTGLPEEALDLLLSTSYQIEKERYAEGNKHYIDELRAELTSTLASSRQKVNGSLSAAFVALLFVVSFWSVLARLMRQQQLKLAAASKAKSEFLAITSHELRTPLTSIKGSLALVVNGNIGSLPENINGMLTIALRNTDRLIRLVNDILDVEKIESGKLEYDFAPLNLSRLVSDAVETNKSYAEQFGVTFVLADIAPEVPVYADGSRLTQVVANLLSNAAKFSPQGGEVKIKVDCGDNIAKATVIDEGPGIPEEMRDHIFDKFTQVDASDTRSIGGTGLGLNISKSIVKQHGGEINFDSKPGAGTQFFFTLPVMQ
jgi:signal transduction histidine kinase